MFDVQIVGSAQEVGQEEWDRLSGGRAFSSYRWYQFGERAMAYAQPIYILLRRHGELVARGTFWLTRREVLPIPSNAACRLFETLFERWPLLLCQSPPSGVAISGLVLPDPPMRDAALRTIAEAALEVGSKRGASFCIFSYLNREEATLPGWPSAFIWSAVPGPGTWLDIVWDDFEGYLGHLGKKQRYNLRRNYRLGCEQGIEITHHPEVLDVDRAMELHQNVNQRYGARTETWVRGTLENADLADAVWLAAHQNGRLVGCELILNDGDASTVTILGLDYSTQYVYFMLGCEDIRYAVERRSRRLRWGSETYDVKRRLGFQDEGNNYLVFAGAGRSLQRLGSWMAKVWGS
jgi:predicted N-acyltransferase